MSLFGGLNASLNYCQISNYYTSLLPIAYSPIRIGPPLCGCKGVIKVGVQVPLDSLLRAPGGAGTAQTTTPNY